MQGQKLVTGDKIAFEGKTRRFKDAVSAKTHILEYSESIQSRPI